LPENVARIPDTMTFDEAATLGVGLIASAAALYDNLKVPRQPVPGGKQEILLIWGGASTAGLIALQLAKRAGLHVLTVSSRRNFSYLSQYGADLTLDRETPEKAVEIAQRHGVRYAIDCVGAETAQHGVQAIAPLSGTLVGLVRLPKPECVPENVKVETILIKRFHEDRKYGEALMKFTESLLQDGSLRAPRIRLAAGGLGGISNGLRLLQDNLISGEKVVVRVRDTPRPSTGVAAGEVRSRPSTPRLETVQRQGVRV
jgi:NADPH:quinone reductase-like Zn-dependent oxidoreductase